MEFRLSNIPDALWRKFKAQCALEGKTLRDKLLECVERAVADKDRKR